MNSSSRRGKWGLGIVLASLKHPQTLVQNGGPAGPCLVFFWRQLGILDRVLAKEVPRLLGYLSQVAGEVISKDGPGSDLRHAAMTESETGRNRLCGEVTISPV